MIKDNDSSIIANDLVLQTNEENYLKENELMIYVPALDANEEDYLKKMISRRSN